jgi:hypothetical protein
MRKASQWALAGFLAAGLAHTACGAEEGGERVAGLQAAADACRALIQSQTDEIARMEANIRKLQDLLAVRKAELRVLQIEEAETKDDARRDFLNKVAIPAKQNEIQPIEQKLQALIKVRDQVLAARRATQGKLNEILAQLGQLPAVQAEIKGEYKVEHKSENKILIGLDVEHKAEIKGEIKGEIKAEIKAEP